MSEQWAFYFDPNKCVGCHACTVACKNHNDIDPGPVDWRRVEHPSTGTFPDYDEIPVSLSCMHCADPPCETVCPADAINKRETDGIVTVNRDACIGCRYCGWACPYGAPQYGDEGLMQKCHLCLGEGPGAGSGAPPKQSAKEGGTKPKCVDTCVGDALDAGPLSEMIDKASEEAAEKFVQGEGPSVVFEPFAAAADGESMPKSPPVDGD